MFFVTLKFSRNKAQATALMAGHNAWLEKGFDEGVFKLAGSLEPRQGGAILASGTTLAELRDRLAQDPFVAEDVVVAEVTEVSPSKCDVKLSQALGLT